MLEPWPYNYTTAPEISASLDDDPTKVWSPAELLAIAFAHRCADPACAADQAPVLRLPLRRELGALSPPPDGCRFEKRIRDLERSLREERRALRQADAFYRRLAFRCFEPTLLAQPRVFPTKRKQLLVGSALDDTAVIKHENLICVHDSGKPVRDYDGSAVEH